MESDKGAEHGEDELMARDVFRYGAIIFTCAWIGTLVAFFQPSAATDSAESSSLFVFLDADISTENALEIVSASKKVPGVLEGKWVSGADSAQLVASDPMLLDLLSEQSANPFVHLRLHPRMSFPAAETIIHSLQRIPGVVSGEYVAGKPAASPGEGARWVWGLFFTVVLLVWFVTARLRMLPSECSVLRSLGTHKMRLRFRRMAGALLAILGLGIGMLVGHLAFESQLSPLMREYWVSMGLGGCSAFFSIGVCGCDD